MKLKKLKLDSINEQKKIAGALINECHALHFSIHILTSMLLMPTADPLIQGSQSTTGLTFAKLSSEDSHSLLASFQIKLEEMTMKIKDFFSLLVNGKPSPHQKSCKGYNGFDDFKALIFNFMECMEENISALEDLKAFQQGYLISSPPK